MHEGDRRVVLHEGPGVGRGRRELRVRVDRGLQQPAKSTARRGRLPFDGEDHALEAAGVGELAEDGAVPFAHRSPRLRTPARGHELLEDNAQGELADRRRLGGARAGRRGQRHVHRPIPGEVTLRLEDLRAGDRRVGERAIDQREAAGAKEGAREGDAREVGEDEHAARLLGQLEERRREQARSNTDVGGEPGVLVREERRALPRPVLPPSVVGLGHKLRVALVERPDRQEPVVVVDLRRLRDPVVLVLEGVHDLVRQQVLRLQADVARPRRHAVAEDHELRELVVKAEIVFGRACGLPAPVFRSLLAFELRGEELGEGRRVDDPQLDERTLGETAQADDGGDDGPGLRLHVLGRAGRRRGRCRGALDRATRARASEGKPGRHEGGGRSRDRSRRGAPHRSPTCASGAPLLPCFRKKAHASSAKSTSWLFLPKRLHRPLDIGTGLGHQWPMPTAL